MRILSNTFLRRLRDEGKRKSELDKLGEVLIRQIFLSRELITARVPPTLFRLLSFSTLCFTYLQHNPPPLSMPLHENSFIFPGNDKLYPTFSTLVEIASKSRVDETICDAGPFKSQVLYFKSVIVSSIAVITVSNVLGFEISWTCLGKKQYRCPGIVSGTGYDNDGICAMVGRQHIMQLDGVLSTEG